MAKSIPSEMREKRLATGLNGPMTKEKRCSRAVSRFSAIALHGRKSTYNEPVFWTRPYGVISRSPTGGSLSEQVRGLQPQFAQPSKLYLRTSPQSLEQLLRMLREVDFKSAPVRSPSVGIRESVLTAEFPGAEELSRTL